MLKFLRITSVILLLAWMTLIFCLSNQVADDSSDTSGRVIKMVISFFYSDFDSLTEEQQAEIIEPFQFIVRKGAHFTLYGILGVFAFLTLVTYKHPSLLARSGLSAGICLTYSISDEIHQCFVAGRSGEIRDVCIDFAGSLLAITFMYLITRLIISKKNNKKVKQMKKKDLLKLNEDMFNRLDTAKRAIDDLKKENAELKAEVERLNSQSEPPAENQTVTQPLKVLEEKLIKQAALSEDTEYGAEIIGKIVVSAAKHCNTLTATRSGEDIKELVNLILGRTEVAKAEILKAVSADISFDEKKKLIDTQFKSAEDYFASVMAQLR